jgi:hypothetical protein
MRQACSHAEAIVAVGDPADGCETCLATGGTWLHLRQCRSCGVTLCCDSSPNRHMRGHWEATGHPVMRSADPGQDWSWCHVDEAMIREGQDGWHAYDPFVAAGTWFAGRHLEHGGEPDSDHVTEEGFPLGSWFAHVRDLRAAGTLDPEDAAEIEALPNWRW